MFNQIKNQNKGIGLIEIIVSISILSVGILGILQAFPRGTAAQRALELETIANHLAQEKIEQIIISPYDDITVGTQELEVRVEPDSSSSFYKFKRTIVVGLVDENLLTTETDIGLKKITITISWPRPMDSGTDSTTLITLLSKR